MIINNWTENYPTNNCSKIQMATSSKIEPVLLAELEALYMQVMWLAEQPKVTASMARAWYTHVVAERVKRRIRQFTGKVSRAAASDPSATLRLEHYMRIQTKLTSLVEAHRKLKKPNPRGFIRVLLDCEQVHIVTLQENYDAMRAGGDYRKAGIKLIAWRSIPLEQRQVLWTKMLRGKVANADQYLSRSPKRI